MAHTASFVISSNLTGVVDRTGIGRSRARHIERNIIAFAQHEAVSYPTSFVVTHDPAGVVDRTSARQVRAGYVECSKVIPHLRLPGKAHGQFRTVQTERPRGECKN